MKRKQKKWFSLAANQNFAPAYRALAYTYDAESYERKTFSAKAASLGDVEAKWSEAFFDNIPTLEELAKMDYLKAQERLISLYYGNKDTQNWEKAFYWADKYYQNTKKYNTGFISMGNYQTLAKLYYLGIGTAPDIAKAEKILAELALSDTSLLNKAAKEAFKDLEHLKMELIAGKDYVVDKVAQAKIQQISDELQADNGAERFFKQASIFIDIGLKDENVLTKIDAIHRAKSYFGVACDMGSQAGCDKYAELNSK